EIESAEISIQKRVALGRLDSSLRADGDGHRSDERRRLAPIGVLVEKNAGTGRHRGEGRLDSGLRENVREPGASALDQRGNHSRFQLPLKRRAFSARR